MSRISTLICLGMLTLGISEASPIYYTFEGTLLQILVDDEEPGYELPDSFRGYKVDQPYILSFMIDVEYVGTISSPWSGTIVVNSSQSPVLTSYFAKYHSGDAFIDTETPFDQPKTDYNYAVQYNNHIGHSIPNGVTINVSNSLHPGYDEIHFHSQNPLQDWKIGVTTLAGINYAEAFDASGHGYWLEMWTNNLVLTKVSESPPVPEPETSMLIGIGLLLVVAWSRKQRLFCFLGLFNPTIKKFNV